MYCVSYSLQGMCRCVYVVSVDKGPHVVKMSRFLLTWINDNTNIGSSILQCETYGWSVMMMRWYDDTNACGIVVTSLSTAFSHTSDIPHAENSCEINPSHIVFMICNFEHYIWLKCLLYIWFSMWDGFLTTRLRIPPSSLCDLVGIRRLVVRKIHLAWKCVSWNIWNKKRYVSRQGTFYNQPEVSAVLGSYVIANWLCNFHNSSDLGRDLERDLALGPVVR